MKKILFIILAFSLVAQCGIYRKTDARKIPGNVNDRVQKNIEEGRRIKFGGSNKSGGGKFSFATSNEMWRATIEILDFIPLNNADYGGGIIITDWYGEENENDAIKISIQFLSNEIRSDALNIKVFKKKCNNLSNCKIIQSQSNINQELRLAILKRAAQYKANDVEKNRKNYPVRENK